MAELDERAWADAIGMYERRYTYAKVTGRDNADWALDADRLMRGDTPDVRGWRVNDPLAGEFERLDYYKRISGCSPISVHVWDLGLFLVSDTEVGMVWSFHAW
ncbi:hypothetical protein AB0E70_01975 [Streptomyces murinus]|uniref:hypothetical protein n=2 Tax=Streptomyces murinus TaxID=33900 RepID=UPI00117D6BC1|nr:hypothetical protein [Streptomyces murinus]